MLTHDKRTPRIVLSCRPFPHQGSVSCFSNLNSNGDFFLCSSAQFLAVKVSDSEVSAAD